MKTVPLAYLTITPPITLNNTVVKYEISDDKIKASTYVDGLQSDQSIVDRKTNTITCTETGNPKKIKKSKVSDYVTEIKGDTISTDD